MANYGYILHVHRWSQHILWTFEHICTYCYVHVLLVLSTRSLTVVEEVSDRPPNGEYFYFWISFKQQS